MRSKLRRYDYLLVGVVSFLYYFILSTKGLHSFIFYSGDSADWLAGSIWWMNVQPYGSPLFIILGHIINVIPVPGLLLKETIGLTIIPASITVATIYLITKKLTNYKIAIVCVLVLLGSMIYLSQATIFEEFAISSMFVTLAFWFYINDKKKLTVLMLALGSAVQIIVILISGLWFLLNIHDIKQWYKTFWIYIVFGLLPYAEVLIMMWLPTPRLLSTHLSLQGIDNYLGATGTFTAMSLFEAPKRILQFCEIFFVSLGFAMIPLFVGVKGVFRQPKYVMMAFLTVLFVMWAYLTDSDPGTWHFLPIAFPLILVLVAIGLLRMKAFHFKIVGVGAVALILANGVFMNASVLARDNPLATRYEDQLKSLPENSLVICESGGSYGLDIYYMMASGVKIVDIFLDGEVADVNDFSSDWQQGYRSYLVGYLTSTYNEKVNLANQQVTDMFKKETDTLKSPRYTAYLEWLYKTYNIYGNDTVQQVRWALSTGRDVYLCTTSVTPYWYGIFQTQKINGFADIERITGVNETWVTK